MIYNIAFGDAICTQLINENYQGVAECIAYCDGFIIEWDSETDTIEFLLESAIGSEEFQIFTDSELEIINELL